jgi:hypothetical protein
LAEVGRGTDDVAGAVILYGINAAANAMMNSTIAEHPNHLDRLHTDY